MRLKLLDEEGFASTRPPLAPATALTGSKKINLSAGAAEEEQQEIWTGFKLKANKGVGVDKTRGNARGRGPHVCHNRLMWPDKNVL